MIFILIPCCDVGSGRVNKQSTSLTRKGLKLRTIGHLTKHSDRTSYYYRRPDPLHCVGKKYAASSSTLEGFSRCIHLPEVLISSPPSKLFVRDLLFFLPEGRKIRKNSRASRFAPPELLKVCPIERIVEMSSGSHFFSFSPRLFAIRCTDNTGGSCRGCIEKI